MTILAPVRPTLDTISKEQRSDSAHVDALVDDAFGPGRLAKAAERLREGAEPLLDLSFVARRGDAIIGSVRLWPVKIANRRGLLLGPIAVDAAHRRSGLGARLVRRGVAEAQAAGWGFIVLVGDAPFFGPLGFSAAPAARIRMPGPVDQKRVMVLPLTPGAADGLEGEVTRAA